MKGQYENSILDQSLKDLNQEIYWKRERSDVIKSTVLRDIEKKDRGLEKNRFFALVSYGVATILTLVLVSSYFLNGSLPFLYGEKRVDIGRSASVEMSKEERLAWDNELYEWGEVEGKKQYIFTEKGLKNQIIPLDAHTKISGILGEPHIVAHKYHGDRPNEMQAFYPIENHTFIMVHNHGNRLSADEAVDDLLKAYGTTEHIVANRRAVLLSDENSRAAQQLRIPTDTYIWYISGGTKEQMIQLANLFEFD